MSNRWRAWSTVLQIVTVITVLALLVYSVVESQNIAASRADAAAQAAARNRVLLHELSDQATALRRSQADQRTAFRQLARRIEVLHGNDPDEAPDFGDSQSSNPPTEPDGQPSQRTEPDNPDRGRDPNPPERDPPQREPPPDEPRPPPSPRPTPSPSPDVCVPLLDICVGDRP